MGGKDGVGSGGAAAPTVLRGLRRDEQGRKRVEKVEVATDNPDTLRYVEKKLREKGVHRMERHPSDGLALAHGAPKSGHGGKYTWEGPAAAELDPAPPAIDEGDPNYVEEEEEASDAIIGEVEVAKAAQAREGVSRIEIQPALHKAEP